jgi:hypothetical protein
MATLGRLLPVSRLAVNDRNQPKAAIDLPELTIGF